MNYYTDIDRFKCKWLEQLIRDGAIPNGDVECSPIGAIDTDLSIYTQCHFFCGIGGWPEALCLAEWPSNIQVWTGSCPCQPFSVAGDQYGQSSSQHLWPHWFNLIKQYRPPIIFGEQVENAIQLGWVDLVHGQLEEEDYTFAMAVLPAAGNEARHTRSRLFFVADSSSSNALRPENVSNRQSLRLSSWQASAIHSNCGLHKGIFNNTDTYSIESIDGLSRPVGIVSGYGNAIVPQVAASFITAYRMTL